MATDKQTGFTAQLSTPSNQIGVYNPGVFNSDAALINGVSGVVGPLVASYKEGRDNSRLTEIEQGLEEEYVRLSEAYKQGAIKSNGEFFRRLNSKVREYESDYPSIADRIRQRVNQEFGGFPGQMGFDAEVSPLMIEQQARDKNYADALSYGIEIRDADGRVDKDATTDLMMKYRALEFQSKFAKPSKEATAAEIGGELNRNLGEQFSVLKTSMDNKINAVASQAGLDDESKKAAISNIIAAERLRYMSLVVEPTLTTSGVDLDEIKKIKEYQESLFNDHERLLTDDKLGSLSDRMRLIGATEKQMGLNLREAMPELQATRDVVGDAATAPVFTAIATARLPNGGTLQEQMASKTELAMQSAITSRNTRQVLSGQLEPTTLSPNEQADVARALNQTVKNLSVVEKLDDAKGQAAYVTACGAICSLAANSSKTSDKEYVMDLFVNKPAGVKLEEMAGNPRAKVTGNQLRKLGVNYLADRVGSMGVQYNPSKGVFEYKESPGFFARNLGGADADLRKLNNALQTVAKSAKLVGSTADDMQVKQYVIDSLGFPSNPNYQKPTVPMELDNVFNEQQPMVAPVEELPEYQVDPVTNRLIPVGK
jgi:hypothetical protein